MNSSQSHPPLKLFGMVCLCLMLAILARADGSQNSADYAFTAESADSGGLRSASDHYTDDGSFSSGDFVSSGNYDQRGGYIGQLANPPVAGNAMVFRTAGTRLLIPLANVTDNWTDADGNRVFLATMNMTTTNNVHLMTNAAYIFYTNSPNVDDQIAYTIRDAQGESAAGTISVMVITTVTGQSQGLTVNDNGGSPTATATFAGIPTYTYSVQRSTNLVSWVTVLTTNAPSSGLFQFTDTFSDLGGVAPSSAYYRLSWSQ